MMILFHFTVLDYPMASSEYILYEMKKIPAQIFADMGYNVYFCKE